MTLKLTELDIYKIHNKSFDKLIERGLRVLHVEHIDQERDKYIVERNNQYYELLIRSYVLDGAVVLECEDNETTIGMILASNKKFVNEVGGILDYLIDSDEQNATEKLFKTIEKLKISL